MNGPTNRARIYLLEQEESATSSEGPAIVGPDGHRELIPPLVYVAVQHVVEAMRAGLGVKVSPLRAELPIDEAAGALGMHADTFRKHVAAGEVPFRSTEQVDWVRLADAIEFSRAHKARRREGLRKLSELMDDQHLDDTPPDNGVHGR